MSDEQTVEAPIEFVTLDILCDSCRGWYVVKVAKGRLADMREMICPNCSGTKFWMMTHRAERQEGEGDEANGNDADD